MVEDGRPRHAGVGGLPHSSRAHRHEPRAGIGRADHDVGDPSSHDRRPDLPEGHPGRGLGEDSPILSLSAGLG